VTANGQTRRVEIEARFRALIRPMNDSSPYCPTGAPQTPAEVKANATPPSPRVQAHAPAVTSGKAASQPTDGSKPTAYTPSYPFGLENLQKTTAKDPPELQKEIMNAFSAAQNDYGLAQYYDAGCLAHAYREWRKSGGIVDRSGRFTHVPKTGCLDRARLVKNMTELAKRGGTHLDTPEIQSAWQSASEEKRAAFSSCYAERYADFQIARLLGKASQEQPPYREYVRACAGALR
jgi:hypothetical protein